MALFKILQGLDSKLNSSTNPVGLTEGYCYFTIDNNMFYVDHKNKNGTLVRSPLNAQNANTITEPAYNLPASVVHELDSDYSHIPSCWAIYSFLDEQLIPAFSEALDLKMDKENPTGTGAISLNRKANTTIGVNSIAMGVNTTASGSASTAFGNDTIASGINSLAAGTLTQATGQSSVALGNTSVATGQNAVAIGYQANAGFNYSTAIGTGLVTGKESQFVSGLWNASDNKNIFVIGNGTSETARSNAFTVAADGNAVLSGNLTVAYPTDTSHAATMSYVDEMASSIVVLYIIEEV